MSRVASGLLSFFLEEAGPSVHNKGAIDAQESIKSTVEELDIEVHKDEFAYWRKFEKQTGGKRSFCSERHDHLSLPIATSSDFLHSRCAIR